MWTNPDEARSDFILAAAVALFGDLLVLILQNLLPFLFTGNLGRAIAVVLVFALTGLVPLLLARYRGEGAAAFGLDGPRGGWRWGIVLAVPVVLVYVVEVEISGPGFGLQDLAGAFGSLAGGPIAAVLFVLVVVARAAGLVLLYAYLTVKARDGFGRTETGELEAVHTFGMGAAGAALLVGLLLLLGEVDGLVSVLAGVVGLALVILLADRALEPRATTTRAAVLAPALIALLLRVQLFDSGFLVSLYAALLAAGLVVTVAVLIESRRAAWAAVPLLVATAVYPSALMPL